MAEKLVSVAIKRNGEIHSFGFKEHWRVRAALGDQDPYRKRLGDAEGFLTAEGRFVSRWEAADIAALAGQISRPMGRELLSADINRW
jgi:hypothetical protein